MIVGVGCGHDFKLCYSFLAVEAEDIKRLGSAINILSTEKLKAQKVSHTCTCISYSFVPIMF